MPMKVELYKSIVRYDQVKTTAKRIVIYFTSKSVSMPLSLTINARKKNRKHDPSPANNLIYSCPDRERSMDHDLS